MNSKIHVVCILILVIDVKLIHCALPGGGSVQETGDDEVRIHGTDFVANGGIYEDEISIAGEANANFEEDQSGEAIALNTNLAPDDVRPVSEVDASTTETIVRDSPILSDASTTETIVRDSPIVPDASTTETIVRDSPAVRDAWISELKSYLDVTALVPNPYSNPSITYTDATPTESDPDSSTPTSGRDHCIPFSSDCQTTISLPEHEITPSVPDTGSKYLESKADSSSLVPGSDSFFVTDIDVTPSVSDHTLNSDITSSLYNKHRTQFVPYYSSIKLMSQETSQKPEHELSAPISDDITADNHNIVSTSINGIVLPEPGMSTIKQTTTNDVTLTASTTTELQYHSASLMTTHSEEMTKHVVDHGYTSLTINHDHTLRSGRAITTPSPNHGMTTPKTSSPDNDMTKLEETSPNNDLTTLETKYHITCQQRIKQPEFNYTFHLLIYQLFTYINDSKNLHVGSKYRLPQNVDLWIEKHLTWLCVVLIAILLQTIAVYHWIRKKSA